MKIYKVWGLKITECGSWPRNWGYYTDEKKANQVLKEEVAKVDQENEWWKSGIDTIEVNDEKGE